MHISKIYAFKIYKCEQRPDALKAYDDGLGFISLVNEGLWMPIQFRFKKLEKMCYETNAARSSNKNYVVWM